MLLVSLTAPVLFADGITVTNLGAALQTATGYTGQSFALYMNAFGEVTGKIYTDTTTNSTYYAFLYNGTSVQNLGTFLSPAGGNSQPTGINSSGEVVGFAYNSTNSPQAFIYEGGIITDLGQYGGTNSDGYGITDSGMVVGTTTIAQGNSNIDVFTDINNTINDVGRPNGSVIVFNSDVINNSGQIAGNSNAAGGQAFYYSTTNQDPGATGGFSAITLPGGGANSTASAIDASGRVIGQAANSAGTQQAFLYTPATTTTLESTVDLGTAWSADSTNSYIGASDALAVNANGEIVGQANVASNIYHAVIFNNNVMTDLGTLPGYADSKAVAVSDNGWVVGMASNFGNSATEAFLYIPPSIQYPDGEMINLTTAAAGQGFASLLTATGINDLGEIIGQGTTSTTNDAYILTYNTAVPEPSSAVSMVLGLVLCGLGFSRSKQR